MSDQTCQCGRPVESAWLCDRCAHTLDVALANIPAYFADLDTIRTRQTRYGATAGKGSVGKTQPLPVDMRFTDDTGSGSEVEYATRSTVVAWTRVALEEWPEVHGPMCGESRTTSPQTGPGATNSPKPGNHSTGARKGPQSGAQALCLHSTCHQIQRRRHPADTIASMCNYLSRMLRSIVAEQWAPEMFDEMLDLEKRLRRLVDRPASKVYLGACTVPLCAGSVYAKEGDETGRCDQDDCRTEYDTSLSRRGLESELDSQLLTAAEIARLSTYLGLKADRQKVRVRVNLWHSRGRLAAAGRAEDGSPRFRYGEVRGLLYAAFVDVAS